MPATHQLSDAFMQDLLSGILDPLLREVQADDTLLMGLRESYISIYYRGGQLLTVTPVRDGYAIDFDQKYDTAGELADRLARHGCKNALKQLKSTEDTKKLVEILSELKRLMDRHPKVQSGHEREFQQVAARINSRSKSSNSSHYFITDIEHTHGNARYDMLGVRWRHTERRDRECLVPVLFEVKYGLGSLDGNAGMLDHLKKTLRDLKNEQFRSALNANLVAQFTQLSTLGLISFKKSTSSATFAAVDDHVQVVFLLAEYVPHSKMLSDILDQCEGILGEATNDFKAEGLQVDLLFASASLCGYAMHERTMLTIQQVREMLTVWNR